jgi:hypothetical protein
MIDWGVLHDADHKGVYQSRSLQRITDARLTAWLIEASLLGSGSSSATIEVISQSPALFPFELPWINALNCCPFAPRVNSRSALSFVRSPSSRLSVVRCSMNAVRDRRPRLQCGEQPVGPTPLSVIPQLAPRKRARSQPSRSPHGPPLPDEIHLRNLTMQSVVYTERVTTRAPGEISLVNLSCRPSVRE